MTKERDVLGSKGFTIVEVMLALALFGVAVTAFAASYLNIINLSLIHI